MKTVRIHGHGGPEVLTYETCGEPAVGCGEALVEVKACALNHLDLWVRRGMPGIAIDMPHILGSDIAGIIAEVGEGVSSIRAGDAVMLSPGVSCGTCRECLSGRDNLCRGYSMFGYQRPGGYAEYVAAPAQNIIPKPEAFDFAHAASLPLTFMTAWHMLVGRVAIKPGETLLVLAGGSGVGSAAIQIGRLLGATVLATAGSEEKLKKAGELGAHHLINHEREDFSARVKSLTSKRGVDVVFEHVGSATWERSVASLAKNGRLVTCGATTGYDARLDLRHLFARHLTLYGSYMGSKGELLDVVRCAEQGHLKPVVDTVLPLKDAARAHQMLEQRSQFGKIVLEIG